MKENLNYIFYKGYYKDLLDINGEDYEKLMNGRSNKEESNNKSFQSISQNNNSFFSINITKNNKFDMQLILKDLEVDTFELSIEYPGLISGIGIAHQIGIKEEIKVGFNFDYTTGMPYIPASSVKGALHSVFRGEKWIYIAHKMGWNNKEKVNELERFIFGVNAENKETIEEGKDIFFDATIIQKEKRLLGRESISPHKSKLKNPIPITMLKVVPGNRIKFSFLLQENILRDGEIITVEKKLQLFKEILKDFGIGAKTNVGFGKLDEVIENKKETPLCRECGKYPVKKNNKTGKWHLYCQKCFMEKQKRKKGKEL